MIIEAPDPNYGPEIMDGFLIDESKPGSAISDDSVLLTLTSTRLLSVDCFLVLSGFLTEAS